MISVSFDGVINNPDQYVDDILSGEFTDVQDGDNVFKGIQLRSNDELQKFAEQVFPGYKVAYNFVRQSPLNQTEPNFIHTDEMMGDKTILLYLNKTFPEGDGTTLYKGDNPMCVFHAEYNRMISFDSKIPHSRNIYENYGEGESSRLVQVIFMKQDDFSLLLDEFGLTDNEVRKIIESEEFIKKAGVVKPEETINYRVDKSSIQGLGAFATRDFMPGDEIGYGTLDGTRTYAGRYTNHAKDNNAKFYFFRENENSKLIAEKEIKKGDEILVNYRHHAFTKSYLNECTP